MFGTAVALVLLAPGAPVPAQPPVQAPKADRFKAQEFARIVWQVGDQLALRYAQPVEMRDLIRAAVRGLYEECGLTVPDRVTRALAAATGATELVEVLADVRLLLADKPQLRGPRAMVAAVNGFRHATDPACQLASPRASAFASSDMDFGIGIELEGASGTQWMLYQAEYRAAVGQVPTAGWLGPVPPPTALAAPATFPWRVSRVIPDSPAQKAGVKPGDLITHIGGTEITAKNVDELFLHFAFPHQQFDPQTGLPREIERALGFRRTGARPFSAKIKSAPYTPMSAFGVMRTAEDKWDCMLDREHKIGYIRIGAVEQNLDEKVGQMLADLERRGCRGLILDLRWCPGGYVDPGVRIAGLFLPDNVLIAKMNYRNPQLAGNQPEIRNTFGINRYTKLPLVVLVGQETTGGGELIASALRDNDRCVLMGQRTVGRAYIQNVLDSGFGGMQFKITTGESLRPNGKTRQKKPDSGPLDEWGVRPDEGLEVPVTKDKSLELKHWADLHALRPADSTDALDFDDPLRDPFRASALRHLKDKLGKPPEKK
jgi:carboxyl-terminal processing protease